MLVFSPHLCTLLDMHTLSSSLYDWIFIVYWFVYFVFWALNWFIVVDTIVIIDWDFYRNQIYNKKLRRRYIVVNEDEEEPEIYLLVCVIIDEFTLLVYCWHRYTNKQTDFGFYIMYNALFCVKIVLVAVLVLQCCPSGIHGNKTTGKKRKRRCRKVCEDEFESLKVWWIIIFFLSF